jgi:hypothetical protein
MYDYMKDVSKDGGVTKGNYLAKIKFPGSLSISPYW